MYVTADLTFKEVNVTIVVISRISGGYDERVRVTKTLRDSNHLMDVLKGRDLVIFNSLRIINQRMPIIYESAFENVNLMKLSIINCDTETIERKAFKNVIKLDHFIMRKTGVEVILRGVFQDLPLRSLDLSNNEIRVVETGAFVGLTSLEEINLSGNKMAEVRHGIFANMTELKMLNLKKNLIGEIEEHAFFNLVELERLWLEDNLIKSISTGVFGK